MSDNIVTEFPVNKSVSLAEAEQSVLGSMLIKNDKISEVLRKLNSEDFIFPAHREMFKGIIKLHDNDPYVDVVNLSEHLEKTGSKTKLDYVAEVAKNTPSAKNVMAYVGIVKRHSNQRQATLLSNQYANNDLSLSDYQSAVSALTPENMASSLPFSWGSEGCDTVSDFIVEGYIPAESFGVVYGPSGTYKSFLALYQACCLSVGMDWNGKKTEKGLVVFIAAEGYRGVSKRIKAWELMTGQRANVAVIGQPIFMDDAKAVDQVISTIQNIEEQCDEKVKLLVVDTLARCMTGDENSATDMGDFISGCDRVKNETKTTVLVIHHSGKDKGKGARGSSALYAACDFEYRVERPEEFACQLHNTKLKDSEVPKPQEFFMQEINLGFVDRYENAVTSLAFIGDGKTPVKRKSNGKATGESDASFLLDCITNECRSSETGLACVEKVRDSFYKFKGDNVKQETKRQNFNRAIKPLREKKLIEKEGDHFMVKK